MAFKFNEYHLGGTGGEPAVIEPITIKENGTYIATDGVDGYSPITVDVAGGGEGNTIPVIEVTELPTENINENALYRIVSVDVFMCMGNTAVNFKEAYPNLVIHVVDTLPETPEVFGSDASVVYVLNDTGNVYASVDGSTCASFADVLGLPSGMVLDFGWVENESMITQDGLYTIRKDARYMYYNGVFVCINEAVIPQVKFVMNDSGDGYIVNGNANYVGNVTIPDEHDGLPVTRIGSFQNCYDVLRVTIPDSVTNMDDGVFRYCPALCHVDMGSGISVIPSKAFYESRIDSIELDHITEIGEEAFAGSCIETFPHFENLITIGSKAFIDCRMMTRSNVPKSEGVSYLVTSLVIPETVETIGSEAFKYTSYKEVQFLGTPTSVDSTAFSECGYLTKIFVPWAEGAVAGAPWGATNAVIRYNHTS